MLIVMMMNEMMVVIRLCWWLLLLWWYYVVDLLRQWLQLIGCECVSMYVFIISFYHHIDYSIKWVIVIVVLFVLYSYYRLLFFITLIIIILIHPNTLYITIYISLFHTSSHLYSFLPSHLFLCMPLFIVWRFHASPFSMWEWTWEYRTGTVREWGEP